VLDTNVFSAVASEPITPLGRLYATVIDDRYPCVSFATRAEALFGASLAGWGSRRVRRLNDSLSSVEVVWPGYEVTDAYIRLRAWCHRTGHGFAGKAHEADRWIAATALWLDLPLVTHDRLFLDVKDLQVLTRLDG
jgi:predicted nucleic acid-binding protein